VIIIERLNSLSNLLKLPVNDDDERLYPRASYNTPLLQKMAGEKCEHFTVHFKLYDAETIACSRRSDSGAQAKNKASASERAGKNEGRLGKKEEVPSPSSRVSPRFFPLFHLVYFSLALHYLNAWNRLQRVLNRYISPFYQPLCCFPEQTCRPILIHSRGQRAFSITGTRDLEEV